MTTSSSQSTGHAHGAAKPIVQKMRWPYPWIWAVPVLAAVAAGAYWADSQRDKGPVITIQFTDGSGLKIGQTPVSHLGVTLGLVTSIKLANDKQHVLVGVQLHRNHSDFARAGTLFWIVRPEISAQTISGLGTVLSGPYIDALPPENASGGSGGSGASGGERGGDASGGASTSEQAGNGQSGSDTDQTQTLFIGRDEPPQALGTGVRITLHAPRLEHVQANSIVFFRGIQVGLIQEVQLSRDATGVDVHAFIQQRYASLVHANSRFWVVPGLDVHGSIFTGVKMELDSLRTIISGGITFATPSDDMGPPAQNGDNFPLFDEPKSDWLKWSPQIMIEPKADVPATQPKSSPPPPGGQTPNTSSIPAMR